MIWNWEKSKLEIENESLMLWGGESLWGLGPSTAPHHNRLTGRMWLCLPAPGHIPFCLGTEVVDTYIIKLLNEDFEAHP